jgi:hypothetical protein
VTYTVDGTPRGTASDPVRVETKEDRFKADDKLEVRYNKTDPDKAIYGESGSGWKLVIGGAVVATVCLFAIYLVSTRTL